MKLAAGIVGPGNKFAVIDTEARRALHYADMFNFDHCEMTHPFRPDQYTEAILAADKAGYKAILVDSMSHEWAGEGGILDWQEEELTRMAGDSYQKREQCKMAAWIKPKMAHKKMVQRLLQVNAHLILCFRAEERVKMEKENGKTVIVPIGFQPICSKELPYELTVSFLLTPDKPGYPQPIKLQEQHKALFPLDKPINEESGRRVAEWAAGGVQPEPPAKITADQRKEIIAAMGDIVKPSELLAHFSVKTTGDMLASQFNAVMAWVAGKKNPVEQSSGEPATCSVCDALLDGEGSCPECAAA
jgi:hypothetical protein